MNKFHYLAAVAISAMTFTGCSNDEVISSSEKSQTIGFNAMANKTGRSEVNTNNIERFRVFGCTMDKGSTENHVTIFDNVTVLRPNTSSTEWTYQNIQYWAPNKDYYFVALSTNIMDPVWKFTPPIQHDGNLNVGDTFKGYGTVNMDVSKVNADNDLVYAYASRSTDADITNRTKVTFSFYHMLSRIRLKFNNAIISTGYTIKVSDIKISGIIESGSVVLGGEPSALAWVPSATTVPVDVTVPNNNNIPQNSYIESVYKYIIPGSQALTIEFTAEVSLNGSSYSTRTLTGTIASKEYKPGVSYMLNASITADNIVPGGAKPIEFTVSSVNGWGTDEDSDITIKNE